MRFRTIAFAALFAAATFTQIGAASAAVPVHTASRLPAADDECSPIGPSG